MPDPRSAFHSATLSTESTLYYFFIYELLIKRMLLCNGYDHNQEKTGMLSLLEDGNF